MALIHLLILVVHNELWAAWKIVVFITIYYIMGCVVFLAWSRCDHAHFSTNSSDSVWQCR